ncbi:MAG: pyridoxal-dependent decarboxylase [Gemmatimonadota bacterium]|nr:pyridoxal-dependent decarboxylase [Gemmatimonadota bacterium]
MASPEFTPAAYGRILERVHRLAVGYLETLPEREAFRRPPDDVVRRFEAAPLPARGTPADAILADVERDILPYSLGIGHPRWWGYVRASPSPLGMAADLLAATMNNNCAGSAQIATYVEMTVMRWLAELVGYPGDAGGLLVSGGSAANFVALAAMREAMLPGSRGTGLTGLDVRPVIYVTPETHSCIRRAVELLGFGSDALRLLPPDDRLRMDPAVLAAAVTEDRVAGRTPLCVVATAGTVNAGAIDPLTAIRDVARLEGLWFHVDGAYGAIGAALPELTDRYAGMDDADSLTIDPHKWLYVPYEAGAVLVKDRNALTRAFATKADYLEVDETSYFSGPLWFHQQGPQLSRAFRALKVWCVMRELGVAGFRELWRNDLAVAAELRRAVAAHPRLELVGPSDLSIVCFRYVPQHGDADALNRKLVNRVQQDGQLFVSGTLVRGTYALRAAILNYRSTTADARLTVEVVAELGAALDTQEVTPPTA